MAQWRAEDVPSPLPPSTSTNFFPKFYPLCLGIRITFTFKEIFLWAVDLSSPFIFSGLRATCIPIQRVVPSACQAARRPACPWLACGGRHGPRRSSTHRGVTRQTRQPDDTRFCVSYHFTNHLRFIYVGLGAPTQSVKPVGLVQLKEKFCE